MDAILQRQIVIHPANTRMIDGKDVKIGMILVEGVVLSVDVDLSGYTYYETSASSNVTFYAEPEQRVCLLGTVDDNVLEAIRLSM